MCPQPPCTSHCGCQVWHSIWPSNLRALRDHGWGQHGALAQGRASPWCLKPLASCVCSPEAPCFASQSLSTRVHLGQAEIFENTTCLFILIFQDFHSSHDDSEEDSRVGLGVPMPVPSAEKVMSPCLPNCKGRISPSSLYILYFYKHSSRNWTTHQHEFSTSYHQTYKRKSKYSA